MAETVHANLRKLFPAHAQAIARIESDWRTHLVHPKSKAYGVWQLHPDVFSHYNKQHRTSVAPPLNISSQYRIFSWYWRWLHKWFRIHAPQIDVNRSPEFVAWSYASGVGRIKRIFRNGAPLRGEPLAQYVERVRAWPENKGNLALSHRKVRYAQRFVELLRSEPGRSDALSPWLAVVLLLLAVLSRKK